MTFTHPWLLALLALAPVALALWWWGRRAGTRNARRLSRERTRTAPLLSGVLLCLSLASGIVAAAGPRWGTTEAVIPRSGAQVVIVLDVSRSMAVRDVAPSRIEATKAALTTALQRLGGDRVGLVIFSGTAILRFPLTGDFAAATQVVESLQPGVALVEGGTNTTSGLDIALNAFDAQSDAGRLIVLVSDGEDLGADPAGVARRIQESGAGFIVFGAGTSDGGQIPVFDIRTQKETVKLDESGVPLVSRLNEPFLRALAAGAGGRYAGADLKTLPAAVEARVANLRRSQFAAEEIERPVERSYPFAAGAAILALLGSLAGRLRLGRRVRRTAASVGLAAAALLVLNACATEAHRANEDGREAYARGDFAAAVTAFTEAQAAEPDNPAVTLNLATALVAAGRHQEAGLAARRALASSSPRSRSRAHSLIGHERFALEDLRGSLESFRQALIEDPDNGDARHDFEVVYRLLNPPPTPEPGQGGDQEPGGGDPSQTPMPGETPAGGEPGGTPGTSPTAPAGSATPGGTPPPGQGAGSGGESAGDPQTPRDVDRSIQQLDREIARLVEAAGEEPTAEEALAILELLAERSRLAQLRQSFGGGSAPGDR